MRKLMWFTLGFAIACGACVYLLPEALSAAVPAAFGAALLCALGGRRFRLFYRTSLLFLGLALGIFWYGRFSQTNLSAPRSMDGKTESVTIRTTDYSFETDYGIGVDGMLTLEGKDYLVRAYLDPREPLEPGTFLTGSFRLRFTASEGEEPSAYHPGKGIFLLAYQRGETVTGKAAKEDWTDSIARLRRQIRQMLQLCFPEDVQPFAQALLLGDTSGLDYETDTNLKLSGIRHVVAVSGLHVSILFALLSTVTFRKRYFTALLGFPALLLFAALAGFSASVTRACLMAGLMLLGMLANREYDGATALSFAALVMLLRNPVVITSVGFQLSVASVAGIYLFRFPVQSRLLSLFPDPLGKRRKHTLIHWFVTSVSISLSAMTLTTPLCAWYFGMVSLVGVATNLLTLWVISFLFYGILAVCLLYTFWASGAAVLAGLVAWPIRYVLRMADLLAEFPLAAVYTESAYITIWLVFVYVLAGIFLLSRNKRPVVPGCCLMLGLCISLLASWAEPLTDDFRLTVLDVGQGQCLLVKCAEHIYMVDCGGDSDTKTADIAAEYLLSRGITEIDGLILTHLDRDHAGAAANFLSRVDAELLILPAVHTDLGQNTEGEVIFADRDLTIRAGSTAVTVYVPTFPGTGNEKSLCVLFDTEKCDILITGDRDGFGERSLLRNADIPQVDVLIAGHHGSANSTCRELLDAASPDIVCISAGADNPYGHPAPELLQRLEEFGCAVYRTDIHGTITIRR